MDRESVPPTSFLDSFWLVSENVTLLTIGIVPKPYLVYKGEIPSGPISQMGGTPQEWLEGLDFQKWIRGDYSLPGGCWPAFPIGNSELSFAVDYQAETAIPCNVAYAVDYQAEGSPIPALTVATVEYVADDLAEEGPGPTATPATVEYVADDFSEI